VITDKEANRRCAAQNERKLFVDVDHSARNATIHAGFVRLVFLVVPAKDPCG